MDKYIEWDLENNPKFFTEAHSGKLVDVNVIRHVVCNVNRPDDVPEEVFKRALNAVAEEVDMIPPAADVALVVHAEWDYEPTHDCPIAPYSTCGNCGMYVMAWNYCPNCGAKMDGGNNDA